MTMAADLRTALLKSIVLQLTALVRDEGASPAIRVAASPLAPPHCRSRRCA
jgi:hypothetical protein